MHVALEITWVSVLKALDKQPAGTTLRLPKDGVLHPEGCGASRSIGLPFGQFADYRWRLRDGRSLHVRDFGPHYEVHIDRVDPSTEPIEHLRQDAPELYVAVSSAVGLFIGILLGGGKESALAGLSGGAVFGLLTVPKRNPQANAGEF